MARLKLTKRMIDGAKPGAIDQFFWDDELRGFGLKVTKGGSKTYLIQYRMGGRGAPTKRFTIGKHGSPWTPASARLEAEKVLQSIQQGVDPVAAAKERQRIEIDLAFPAYATQFLSIYGEPKWRSRTYASVASDLRRWVVPKLKGKSLPNIKRYDVSAVLDALPTGSPALPRNIFRLMHKLFAWAVERGAIERSPLEGMKCPAAVPSRDRVLTDRELLLVLLASQDMGPVFGSFLQLLVLTGQRRDEVAALSWAELNYAAKEWQLPARRAKNWKAHTVPLSNPVINVLTDLAGGNRWPTEGLVFSTTGISPISGFSRAKRRLDKIIEMLAGSEPVPSWRLHDIRRTVATGFQKLNVRFEVTEAVLNHISGSKGGVAGIYQRHDWAKEKRGALDAWGATVISLIDDKLSILMPEDSHNTD